MADKCRGAVSMTPVVLVADDADGTGMHVIHHDIKKTLGGKLEYAKTAEQGDAKWFYHPANIVSANANLIPGTAHDDDKFTDDSATVAASDDIRFIFIKHLGHDGADPQVASGALDKVFFTFDSGDPNTQPDAIELEAGESIVLKFKSVSGVAVDQLKANKNGANANVAVQVAAMIDDGA